MENDFAERIRKAAEEVSQSIDHEKQEKEREEAERTRRTEQAGQTLERLGESVFRPRLESLQEAICSLQEFKAARDVQEVQGESRSTWQAHIYGRGNLIVEICVQEVPFAVEVRGIHSGRRNETGESYNKCVYLDSRGFPLESLDEEALAHWLDASLEECTRRLLRASADNELG